MENWIEKYKNMIAQDGISIKDISKFAFSHIPQNIYKYKAFDNNGHWKDLLYKGKIYMTPASMQNDPFDCLISVDFNKVASSKEFLKHFKLVKGFELQKHRFSEKECKEIVSGIQQDIRMTCFSDNYSSILMWSHYTRNYEGVCIEYNTNKFSQFVKNNFYAVVYDRKRNDLTDDLCRVALNTGLKSVLYKADDWSYENEWRIIFLDPGMQDYIYTKNAISSVTVGTRCDESRIREIKDWASKRTNPIPVYQICLCDNEYKLTRKPI